MAAAATYSPLWSEGRPRCAWPEVSRPSSLPTTVPAASVLPGVIPRVSDGREDGCTKLAGRTGSAGRGGLCPAAGVALCRPRFSAHGVGPRPGVGAEAVPELGDPGGHRRSRVAASLPPRLRLGRCLRRRPQKRRSPPRKREEVTPPTPAPEDPAQLKNLRSEEQKKKNRKKLPEKPKPNGRTVEIPEDEVVRTPRSITAKQPPETDKKNEKSKKNKKKSKSDAKAVQNSSRHDGKEVDEGAWETKISHREKRQQRKRDKVLTDSGSLDSTIPGIENTITVTTEQLTTASFPVGSKKNKGDSHLNVQVSNFKSGKGDSTLQVSSGLNENITVNGGGWSEKSVKLSSQLSAGEEKWNSVPPASAGKRKTEQSAWTQDPGDTNANGKDWGRNWSDRSIFSGIGSTAEPVSQSTTSDYQWDGSRNQPHIDDEWSGLNGLSSADPSSDWNAPAEEWGNWVDEDRASLLKSQEPISNDQKDSDDDKEKGEGALPTGKSKKKKRKRRSKVKITLSPRTQKT